ncbi:MAG: alkaline phosphatase family protein, partial [Terriglobia bacterium]
MNEGIPRKRTACILLLIASGYMMAGCGRRESEAARHKVIVLGIDGMDPQLLHRYKQDGRMPNFQRLERDGSFRELRTSVPPQSPVAWSNVITG